MFGDMWLRYFVAYLTELFQGIDKSNNIYIKVNNQILTLCHPSNSLGKSTSWMMSTSNEGAPVGTLAPDHHETTTYPCNFTVRDLLALARLPEIDISSHAPFINFPFTKEEADLLFDVDPEDSYARAHIACRLPRECWPTICQVTTRLDRLAIFRMSSPLFTPEPSPTGSQPTISSDQAQIARTASRGSHIRRNALPKTVTNDEVKPGNSIPYAEAQEDWFDCRDGSSALYEPKQDGRKPASQPSFGPFGGGPALSEDPRMLALVGLSVPTDEDEAPKASYTHAYTLPRRDRNGNMVDVPVEYLPHQTTDDDELFRQGNNARNVLNGILAARLSSNSNINENSGIGSGNTDNQKPPTQAGGSMHRSASFLARQKRLRGIK